MAAAAAAAVPVVGPSSPSSMPLRSRLAGHVISSDVLQRDFDASSEQLHTRRLLVKTNHMPRWGALLTSVSVAYVIEDSVVDARSLTMTTHTRNISSTSLLEVHERTQYSPCRADATRCGRGRRGCGRRRFLPVRPPTGPCRSASDRREMPPASPLPRPRPRCWHRTDLHTVAHIISHIRGWAGVVEAFALDRFRRNAQRAREALKQVMDTIRAERYVFQAIAADRADAGPA